MPHPLKSVYAHAIAGASCSVRERQSGQVEWVVGTFLPSSLWIQEQVLPCRGCVAHPGDGTCPAQLPLRVPTPGTTCTCNSTADPTWVAFPIPGRTTLSRLQTPDSANCQTCRAFACLQMAAGCGLQAGGQMDTWPGLQFGLKLLSWVWFPTNTADCLLTLSTIISLRSLCATQRAGPGDATNRGDQIRSDSSGSGLFARPARQPMAICAIYSQALPDFR